MSASANTVQLGNNVSYAGLGGITLIAGNADTISLSGSANTITLNDSNVLGTIKNGDILTIGGGSNTLSMKNGNTIAIEGGGNTLSMNDGNAVTIDDARSEAAGFTGSINFGDTITAGNSDTISLNYTLNLGNSDVVTVSFQPSVSMGASTMAENFTIIAGNSDKITLAGSNQAVWLTAGSGDTITTTGSKDTVTLGGGTNAKNVITLGATAPGTTINGGVGIDTITAGSGYTGGNLLVGSPHGYQDGFAAIGSCANYAPLACRVTVNLQTNVGQGFGAAGNLLWTDTYTNMQQVKAGLLDGNALTGSDSYYCELKAGLGQTTYYGGAAGDRIVWSSAGATGLLDGHGTDIAYGGNGPDEFYWRNSPGGKGVSNFGETINGFNPAQGDDLNLSEFADAGFAGVSTAFTFSDISNWVSASMSSNGQDTNIWFDRSGTGNFTQLAAVLKNENLFNAYGVTDQSSAGAQQVVQNMYNCGQLVFTQPH